MEEKITEILRGPLEHLGYEIVLIRIEGQARKVVEILIERVDGEPVSVGDCMEVSKEAAVHLDVEDPIRGAYVLEVSSPGLDRPLVKQKDYERFAGKDVQVVLYTPIEGRRKFKGRLLGIAEDTIQLKLSENEETVSFSHSDVKQAKLVPTFRT